MSTDEHHVWDAAKWVGALSLVGATSAALWYWCGGAAELSDSIKTILYPALTGLFGTLLGFSLAASTFVLSVIPHRVMKSANGTLTGRHLNLAFLFSNIVFMSGVFLSLSCVIFDRGRYRWSTALAGVTGGSIALLAVMFFVLHSLLQGVSRHQAAEAAKEQKCAKSADVDLVDYGSQQQDTGAEASPLEVPSVPSGDRASAGGPPTPTSEGADDDDEDEGGGETHAGTVAGSPAPAASPRRGASGKRKKRPRS